MIRPAILSDEIQVTRVFVSVEILSPPSVFSVGTLPRFEMSADERRSAFQNSVSIFLTSRVFGGQSSEPFHRRLRGKRGYFPDIRASVFMREIRGKKSDSAFRVFRGHSAVRDERR